MDDGSLLHEAEHGKMNSRNVNIEDKKTEGNSQNIDIEDKETEGNSQNTDIEGRKTEVKSRNIDIGDREAETKSQIADIGNRETDKGQFAEFSKPGLDNMETDYIVLLDKYSLLIEKKGGNHATTLKTRLLFYAIGLNRVFGRADVLQHIGGGASSATNLLKRLQEAGVIEAVKGQGKGKYRFVA